jgi:hypothetical protein
MRPLLIDQFTMHPGSHHHPPPDHMLPVVAPRVLKLVLLVERDRAGVEVDDAELHRHACADLSSKAICASEEALA